MKRAASGGLQGQACRRRLTWPQIGSSQDNDEFVGTDEVHDSACPDAASPITKTLDGQGSSPAMVGQAPADSSRVVAKSPIIHGALFLEGRPTARFSEQPSRAAAAEVGMHQQETPGGAAQEPHGEQQQQVQDSQEAAALECHKALAAAGSSSRGCLDLLCWGVALDQQQAAESPSTPVAAACVLLPARPRKCSAVCVKLSSSGLLQRCRAARLLPGLAPTNEADLQQVRDWFAVREVQ